jgi:hypothetical protein
MPSSLATNRIHESLDTALARKRVVLWYDPNGEWASEFDHYQPAAAKKLRVDGNEFSVKVAISRAPLDHRFLLYLPCRLLQRFQGDTGEAAQQGNVSHGELAVLSAFFEGCGSTLAEPRGSIAPQQGDVRVTDDLHRHSIRDQDWGSPRHPGKRDHEERAAIGVPPQRGRPGS